MKLFETEKNDMWIVEGDRYDDVRVHLAIRSADLSIESISKNLGLSCTRGFERGDEFFSGRTQKRGERLWGVWSYESKHFVSSDKLTDHLDYILSIFEPIKDKLKCYMDDKSYTVALRIDFCESWSIASCEFDKETMGRIMSICDSIYLCLATDVRNADAK